LRLETVWQDKLMVARSVAREAQERERNANDARDRAIRDAENYERKWRDAKRESSEKQKQIDTLKRERDELQREIASIRTSMDAGDADGA
jgi:chromosome segregation ATPase